MCVQSTSSKIQTKKLIPIVFHANSQQKIFASFFIFYFKASFITSFFKEKFSFSKLNKQTKNLFFFTFCVFFFGLLLTRQSFFLIEILQIRLAGEFHAHSHTHLHLHSQQQQEAAGFQLPREFVFELKLKKNILIFFKHFTVRTVLVH